MKLWSWLRESHVRHATYTNWTCTTKRSQQKPSGMVAVVFRLWLSMANTLDVVQGVVFRRMCFVLLGSESRCRRLPCYGRGGYHLRYVCWFDGMAIQSTIREPFASKNG